MQYSFVVNLLDAEFISTEEVRCRQPDLSLMRFPEPGFPDPTYLEISLDGQRYSQSRIKYTIVGPRGTNTAMQASTQVLSPINEAPCNLGALNQAIA